MEFSQSVDALIGLAAFPAEQVLAMSLSKNGLDLDRLWERKCQAVEQTPGLTIWRGGETFDQIGGCENIKRFLAAVLLGREAPRVIVFVDEIEKAFVGHFVNPGNPTFVLDTSDVPLTPTAQADVREPISSSCPTHLAPPMVAISRTSLTERQSARNHRARCRPTDERKSAKKSLLSLEAEPSRPRPTSTPRRRSSTTRQMPSPRRMLERAL